MFFYPTPLPSKEYQSDGVTFEQMGAPHPHATTQAAIEEKVRKNAAMLKQAPYDYRSAIGWQANRVIEPVAGPMYGDNMNTFPEGTPTKPNSPLRFTLEYQKRGGGFSRVQNIEKPDDVRHFDPKEAAQKEVTPTPKVHDSVHAFQTTPVVSISA